MYKLTLITAIALGSMAFVQSGKSNRITTDENHVNNNLLSFASPDQGQKGGKGNKGGGGGSHGGQAGPSKHNQPGAHGNGGGNVKFKQHQQGGKPKNNQFKDHGNNAKSYKPGKGHSYKPGKNHFDKGHPNFGYNYISKHGYISHKNYGQWRSQQARNKHKKYHPIYEYEAVEGFNFIIGRNVFLYSETDYKMNLYRTKLSKKRKAGTISVVEYDNSIRRVYLLEQRRDALQINIEL